MLEELFGLVIPLCSGFELVIFLITIGVVLGGDLDRIQSEWETVLWFAFLQPMFVLFLQLLALGVVWIAQSQGLSGNLQSMFSNRGFIYVWGLRALTGCDLLRVVWPLKKWNERYPGDGPIPSHPRLKLLGCAVLTLALSFLPIVG